MVTVEPARSRGVVLSLVGMVGLAARELFAISAAHALVDTGRGDVADSSYGVPMVVIGLGMVVAGVGLARHLVLPRPGRGGVEGAGHDRCR